MKTLDQVERFQGAIFTVVSDRIELPDGTVVVRDYVRHPGAVGVVPLDENRRVLLVRQLRAALGRELWELPAGLVDVPGEAAEATARRELAEETDLQAGRLDHLVDLHTSPGSSDELIRLFLARDLSAVPDGERHARQAEEATMTVSWFDLDEAVDMALRGDITNAAAVAGLLAAARVAA